MYYKVKEKINIKQDSCDLGVTIKLMISNE